MRNPHCTTQALFKRCDGIKGGASSSPRRSFLFPSKSSIREAPPYRPPSGTGEGGEGVCSGVNKMLPGACRACPCPLWSRAGIILLLIVAGEVCGRFPLYSGCTWFGM